MKSVCIFCGSGEGFDPIYKETAYDLGAMLASRGITIVYGGARIGLMGAVADGALNNGGKVIGIMPRFLQTEELMHEQLTDLIIVNTMHERKIKMHELSDAVITLPGGWGTMEEMFEMLTWGQLGMHEKPIGLLNINGYYDALHVLCNNMVQEGFLPEFIAEMKLVAQSAEELLDMMEQYTPPIEVKQLITKSDT
jgi:TIGR00730 family protein